jgi:hypothetical protein
MECIQFGQSLDDVDEGRMKQRFATGESDMSNPMFLRKPANDLKRKPRLDHPATVRQPHGFAVPAGQVALVCQRQAQVIDLSPATV